MSRLILAAIEEFMDAKIAWSKMTPEQRRPLTDALKHKREKAAAALSTLSQGGKK